MDYKKVLALLLVGIVILAGMIIFIGPGEILEALEQANINYVILAIVIQLVVMFLWTLRWNIISKSLDIPCKMFPMFAMLTLGLTINNLTPSGRTGGEPVRAYLLGKSSNVDFRRTFATVMGDKLFDTFPFAVLALVAMLYLVYTIHLSEVLTTTLLVFIVIFVVLLALILYICINEKFANNVISWIFRQARRVTSRDLDSYEEKSLSAVHGFQEGLYSLMKNRKVFVFACIISFSTWFLEITRVYVIFLAFGVHVSPGMVAAVFLVSTLVGMVPTLPGGLGAIDGVMIIIYSLAGITTFISTAATLIERLISFWMVSIMGLLTLPYFGTGVLDKVSISQDKEDT